MPLVEWNDKMNVGVGIIDSQHKKLVEIVNKLHDSLKNNSFETEIRPIYASLIDYTKYHFEAEEGIMEKAGYEDLEAHKKQHKGFVDKLVRFKSRCHQGREEIAVELSSFLSNWLISHILHSDKDYIDTIVNSDWYKNHRKSA